MTDREIHRYIKYNFRNDLARRDQALNRLCVPIREVADLGRMWSKFSAGKEFSVIRNAKACITTVLDP